MTIEQAVDGAKRTIETVGADGTRTTQVDTAKLDGKDYPRTGSPYADTNTMERIDAYTWKDTLKKAGKVVAASIETLSKDGKVYKVTITKLPSGSRYRSIVEVFDKQ